MNILVTGGAGFIGSFIVDKLVNRGYNVTIFDNLDPQVHINGKTPNYLNKDARFTKGDVRDYDALKKAVLNADVIFHQASAVGVGQSQYEIKHYVDVNISGMGNLLDILANNKHNIKKVIIASSMSTYGEGLYRCENCGKLKPALRNEEDVWEREWDPKCPNCNSQIYPIPTDETTPQICNSIYAITKKTQEEMVINFGLTYKIPTVTLRYFNVYGPRQSLSNPYTGVAAIFMSRIKNDKPPIIFEDGQQSRDFVSVYDIVQANMLAMEKEEADYQIFNVSTGERITILNIAETLAELYGKDIRPEVTNKFRKGDVRHCIADITKIQQILGYKPQIELRDGMRELIEWARGAEAMDKFDKAKKILEEKGIV